MADNVILLQRPTPSLERQMAVCMRYLAEHDYELVATARTHPDLAALVFNGRAKLVIATHPAPDDWRLERVLDEVGGRLEVIRETPEQVSRLGYNTEEIIHRMVSRGGTIADIVRLWGATEERVRKVLRRHRNA